ncbi:MAG: response regulator transcription factor [Gemmatimonadaceae bacterium]|nr:response regulator transcription factor [Gemmatimonadaceae bacterium]
MKCFVVEDSMAMRLEITGRLAQLPGLDVIGFASTCDAAVAAITTLLPDLVTLDIRLEQGTGLEVLSAIRRRLPGLTIIVLTNNADPMYRARVLADGADFFFDKSSEFEAAIALCAQLGGRAPSAGGAAPCRLTS